MQQVKNGDKIKVHYHGKLTSGETFDKSEGREPWLLRWVVVWLSGVLMTE